MKIRIRLVWTLVVLVAAGLSPFRAFTGPALPVTKPPVTPLNWTGPASDPLALQCQWFSYPDKREVVCTNEFYDNIVSAGGGYADTHAIDGYVISVLFDANGNLTNFCILATIYNDTGATLKSWADGSNRHGETLQYQMPQTPVTMQDTRLAAEFAIRDVNWLPRQFTGPYRLSTPFIEAINEDLSAWYCWYPDMPDPPPDFQPGNYYVPAWDFGTIPPGQSATRQLCFDIPAGLPPTDPRLAAILNSFQTQADILLNRTTSLKISTWIDDPALDTGVAYPDPEPLRGSDASVFFNLGTEPPPDPCKWVQPPDLGETGMDVECTVMRPILLADDFLCTTNTAVTNIVIWGSWFNDELPQEPGQPGSPSNVLFTLSFHADIPAGVGADWNLPGEPLWTATFTPGTFEARIEAGQIVEGWYDPAASNYLPIADWTCWRYTFPVDVTRAFVQTGTVDNPIVYWLDVQAHPIQADPPTARFGWKTSFEPWNDDACWAPALDPYSGFWWEMRYPQGHPWYPESIDLAFMLFGGPAPEEPEWDFGDAPDTTIAGSAWNYPTRLPLGACHQIDPTGPWLGAPADPLGLPDAEPDGQPDINALGDDNNGYDDENGVHIPTPMVAGQSPIIQVLVSDGAGLGGNVDAWFDWNGDGDWNDLGEQMLAGSWMSIGFNPVVISIPGNATNGWIFARFRISRQGGLLPTGAAPDGEVEDYEVFIDHADWGDAPDSPVAAGYPTLSVNNGAWHLIKPGLLLGVLIDAEPDGQPSVPADGDDLALTDDEDGIQLISGLYPGLKASVKVTVVGTGLLSAWLDINADNDWNDPGEKVLADVSLSTGTHPLTFNVPALASPGRTYMRWRYSTIPFLTPRGGVADGEVEDYRVEISELAEAVLDFGDAPAPFPTLRIANGARHVAPLSDPHFLGTLIDPENDGQPGAMASGDDLNNLDDEDGVLFPSNALGQAVLVQGSNLTIRVVTPGSPWLSAWVDFNGNGSWADAGETIAAAYSLSPGTNALTVAAPSGTFLGKTYARFRTSSMNVPLAYTGAVADGEVEDYLLFISQPRPAGGTSITITNLTHSVSNGVLVQWNCDPALLTQPQACSNILAASTNPADWAALTGWGTFRFFQDQDTTNRPVRFYRIMAPFIYP